MTRATRTPEGIRQVKLWEEVFCCPVYLLLEVDALRFDAWLGRELHVKQAAGHPAYRAGQAVEVRDRDTRQLTALVISFNGRWCRSVDNILVLMHEVHHCVTFLLTDRGIKHSTETEDLWANQPYRVEVWVEKDALVSVIERACQARRVPFFSCRGYASQSEVWSASERFKECGKPVRIIHLGDHDPSGCDMTRDIEARLVNVFGCPSLEVDRIALNMDQIRKYNPPPNPAKLTDSRCEGYMATHGDSSWELDALEPRVLHTLITDAIERSIDSEVWDHDAEIEAGHRTELTRFRDEYDTANQLLDAAANGDNLVDMKADLYEAREELATAKKNFASMEERCWRQEQTIFSFRNDPDFPCI